MLKQMAAGFAVAFFCIRPAHANREEISRFEISGSTVECVFSEGPYLLPLDQRMVWIKESAKALADFYGKFPVPFLRIEFRGSRKDGVSGGVTYPRDDGGLITINLGRSSSLDVLRNQWELTHEMVHLACPTLDESHHWLEEGLATYVEPWIRIHAGQITAEAVWRELVRDMPQGVPQAGDGGLDHNPSWAKTYWGGALFCLLADVRIRELSHNAKGLRDALRAVNSEGNISDDWKIERVFAVGDRATGVPVLATLYQEMKDQSPKVELPLLWKKLGVPSDSAAPEKNIRASIETYK